MDVDVTKEATARIKINRLLEAAGWRFFADGALPANIRLEPGVSLKSHDLDALGNDFETTGKGYVDFLLLERLSAAGAEAKVEDKNPLVGKEQARKYARAQNCRFVILSNGNLHYFWDLERGNPYVITAFPTPESVSRLPDRSRPNPARLIGRERRRRLHRPHPAPDLSCRGRLEERGRAPGLHPGQQAALPAALPAPGHPCSCNAAVGEGKDRFLFEMATGTGKTLTAAAIIKLYLRSGNARRVLFLVDRLELEDQAKKAFAGLLSADFQTVIYKENRDDWRRAEIVVTTVQSLLFNNKYQRLFSPTDFDLVISDEAHRSIGGNARAVFDYFVGDKLGLTATPRDYLRRFDAAKPGTRDPREAERRLLLDTYRTFGCESGQPTFRYSLLDGVQRRLSGQPHRGRRPHRRHHRNCSPKRASSSPSPTTPARISRRPTSSASSSSASSRMPPTCFLQDLSRKRPARSGQRRDRQVHRLCRQPAPRRQAGADPQPDRRPDVPRQVPVRLRRAGHLAGARRPAVHHQLRQQQPARRRQFHPRLQDQQGARVRHRRHDDHRLRLHRSC